jgi:protein SCO1/2
MPERPLLHRTLLGLAALLWSIQGSAATAGWPAGTPPGQPPVVVAQPVDEVPPAPTLQREAALRASQAAIGRSIADHTLLDREGRPVRLASYRGKPLLVSFIYTGCFQVCPTSTRSLQESLQLLYETFGADKFNVVSIGFNQPADSPAALRAFAAQHSINEPNWHFLSPPLATVDAITRDFGFSYLATPSGFDHVVGVSVVDGEGRVYAQVYGERMTPDQLGEPLRRLLRGAPIAPQSGLADLVERVRIICTVYDAETGTYRTDYGLILEIAGGLTFILVMLWFFIAEARSRRRDRLA